MPGFSGKYHVKLCDFGLAKVKAVSKSSTGAAVVGTYPWMAPETISRKKPPYNASMDMFSFGMIIWEVCARKTPFADVDMPATIPALVMSGHGEPVPEGTPPPLAELMERCRHLTPEERPSSAEAREVLRHMDLSAFGTASDVQRIHETLEEVHRGVAGLNAMADAQHGL